MNRAAARRGWDLVRQEKSKNKTRDVWWNTEHYAEKRRRLNAREGRRREGRARARLGPAQGWVQEESDLTGPANSPLRAKAEKKTALGSRQ